MNILQICHKPPCPPQDGGCLAMHHLTQMLMQKGNNVKVLTIDTPKHPFQKESLTEDYIQSTSIESVFIDTSIKTGNALFNLLSSRSYHIERFYSKILDNKIREVLQKDNYDIILLESIFVTPYLKTLRQHFKGKIILRSHNVEFAIWQKLAQTAHFLKKYYLTIQTQRLKKYEIHLLNQYDAIMTISKNDEETYTSLGCNLPMQTIPYGIAITAEPTSTPPLSISLFHIGSMDWLPNQEGIRWFLENVWGKIHSTHKDIQFYIAGRNIPEWLSSAHYPNCVVEGEVEDAGQFMQSKSIMVVPLFSGSGIRIKIIEAMALGKTVVATSVAAKGIDYEDKKNILIADTPEQFAAAIKHVLDHPLLMEEIGKNAYRLVQEKYNNDSISKELINFLNF